MARTAELAFMVTIYICVNLAGFWLILAILYIVIYSHVASYQLKLLHNTCYTMDAL
jgi:hypothetical protein